MDNIIDAGHDGVSINVVHKMDKMIVPKILYRSWIRRYFHKVNVKILIY
jgi:hypothetical protein